MGSKCGLVEKGIGCSQKNGLAGGLKGWGFWPVGTQPKNVMSRVGRGKCLFDFLGQPPSIKMAPNKTVKLANHQRMSRKMKLQTKWVENVNEFMEGMEEIWEFQLILI
jgi:hypothetical protein